MAERLDAAVALERSLQNNASAPAVAAAGSSAGSSSDAAPVPAWKSFSAEQLRQIEEARAAIRAKGAPALERDPKGSYGSICRACAKPNSVDVTFCTGCSFPSVPEDVVRLPDNIFLELVNGVDIGAKVHYRSESYLCFDDKYPVSENHLDVIPAAVYPDVTALGREHVPMLERLYELGKAEFSRRNIAWLPPGADLTEWITAGYNYPVSVKHLHLHMVLPPFRHEKVFQYPRWHSHSKVVSDLKAHGKVILYCDQPNEAEGQEEYARAMRNSTKAKELQEAAAGKDAGAAAGAAAATAGLQ